MISTTAGTSALLAAGKKIMIFTAGRQLWHDEMTGHGVSSSLSSFVHPASLVFLAPWHGPGARLRVLQEHGKILRRPRRRREAGRARELVAPAGALREAVRRRARDARPPQRQLRAPQRRVHHLRNMPATRVIAHRTLVIAVFSRGVSLTVQDTELISVSFERAACSEVQQAC